MDYKKLDYKKLAEYCDTVRQFEIFDALIEKGSARKAAKKLGCGVGSITNCISRVKKRASRQGYSPEHDMRKTVPDGFHLKGTSTLYGDDGEVKLQWVKSNIDLERQAEMIQEIVAALCEEIPKTPAILPPKTTISNLLNCYTITDYHLGMLSWPEETGDKWNLDIATETLSNWFSTAIHASPDAEVGVFANIGDFLHWDGMEAVTPAHRHVLDADTRFQKLVRTAIHLIRNVIKMLLEKHKKVHVIMADANHDPAGEVWLREMLAAFYDDEPRITIDNTADSYYCYEWGLTSLFWHHGHKRKPENIDDVFVAKYREVFGRTKFSYAHMGHMHYNKRLETNLMEVEQHRTLAASDAYASKGGWMSGRDAKVITYSKDYGEVSRLTISPEMLK